jgi:hypothetical protein
MPAGRIGARRPLAALASGPVLMRSLEGLARLRHAGDDPARPNKTQQATSRVATPRGESKHQARGSRLSVKDVGRTEPRAELSKMIDVGMQLKSDEMIDFLELHDLSVEYHFDRLHEGQSDSYSVESEELPIELRFDAEQRCTTIFVRDPAAALTTGIVSFPNLRSPKEVEEYARSNRLALRRGPSWLRCDGPVLCHHYEFAADRLTRVTIMSSKVAP